MNLEKRNIYIDGIYPALHTLSLYCSDLDPAWEDNNIIKSVQRKKIRDKDEYRYYVQLNPNKLYPGSMIRTYSEYKAVVQQALDLIEAKDCEVIRADMSFNSNDPTDYDTYSKLNRLLICCIAEEKKIKNCYESRDLWTFQSLSIAVKNEYIEAENYNKCKESPNVETKNRLELRSKRMTCGIEEEFRVKWAQRLDAAVEQFDAVQERYNAELSKIWYEDLQKPERERIFVSWRAFVLQFKECIFTRKQLCGLLQLMGVSNPEAAAKRMKDRKKLDFYSKTDLKEVVKALKHAMDVYFES